MVALPEVLSRYSGRCILLFVSWFVSALLPVHLSSNWIQPAPNDDARHKASAVMNRIGTELLKQSKNEKSSTRKDILSVLAQANTTEEKAYQMSDEDVLSRAYKPILTGAYTYIHQRSLLSSSLVMKQQGTHVRPSDILQSKKNYQNLNPVVVSRCHGHYILYLKIKTLKRNFVKRYIIYPLLIQRWMI
jgi:hypothetical protein